MEWWISQPVSTTALFLKSDGTVWSTGYNQYGSLGDGTIVDRDVPVQAVDASGDPLTQIIQISGGGAHTLFLQTDGTVWASGLNDRGQLGDGTIHRTQKSGTGHGWLR